MDSDIGHIIEEEGRLLRELEDSRLRARERVELRRRELTEFRAKELGRILSDFRSMNEIKVKEIKEVITGRLKESRDKQERLLDNDELKKKITGRIVEAILDNRT